jgi:hypothetical protein
MFFQIFRISVKTIHYTPRPSGSPSIPRYRWGTNRGIILRYATRASERIPSDKTIFQIFKKLIFLRNLWTEYTHVIYIIRLITSSTIRIDHQKYVPAKGTIYQKLDERRKNLTFVDFSILYISITLLGVPLQKVFAWPDADSYV